jgi:hypothetical protein
VYKQMAASVESLLDLKHMPLEPEELIGRLAVVEERGEDEEPAPSNGRLYLTEEEWEERYRQRDQNSGARREISRRQEKQAVQEEKVPGQGQAII